METPIPLHTNIIIELTKIVKYKFTGEIELHKHSFFIADIKDLAECKKKDAEDKWKVCTRVYFNDGTFIVVKEKYKKVFETWVTWWGNNQEKEKINSEKESE